MRAALLALVVCGCVDAHAGTTGLSTDKARTAAPVGVDLASAASSEGTSLAFARADHVHAVTGSSLTAQSPNALTLKGNVAAASGPAVIIDNVTAQNAGQDLLSVRTGGVEKMRLSVSQDLVIGSVDIAGGGTASSMPGGIIVAPAGLGYSESENQASTWSPQPAPIASLLTSEANLTITTGLDATLTASGANGDSLLTLGPGIASLINNDGATTVSSGTDGTLTLNGTQVGGITLNAAAGTISLSSPSAFSSSKNVGCVALTSGTPSTKTVTVTSGTHCVCSEATTAANNANLKCAVSSTTLTITGPNTVTDTICYFCG